jgi:N-hydroxyarylamine O-acetyltransferase
MNVDDYLNRINSLNFKENSVQNLFRLQQNHLLNVPFENLDVHLNKKVKCNLEELYEKVIVKKRGGKLNERAFIYNLTHSFLENEYSSLSILEVYQ